MNHLQFANQIAVQHGALTQRLTSEYLRLRLAGQQLAPRAVVDMQIIAHRAVADFVRAADAQTAQYLSDVAGGALADRSVTERGMQFVHTLRTYAYEHVSELTRRARGAGVKSVLTTDPGSALRSLMLKAEQAIEFKAADTAGRVWNANQLVRFLARDFAYQLGIDAQARAIAEHGDVAQIIWPDAGHANNGMLVSISGLTDDLPTLAEVRDTAFHPNASAMLRAYVPADA